MIAFCHWAALLIFVLGDALTPSWSQQEHQHPVPEKLGEVSFLVSCAPAVQQQFDRGVALLHSFAYSAAEANFLEIARTDPDCAMAHWGVAMSYYHQLWEPPISPGDLERGGREVQEAQDTGRASPRERSFIDALAVFYRDATAVPQATRALAYQEAMAAVAGRYPKDLESQIFYALSLLSTASSADRTHAQQKRAAEILEPLFRQYPDHPGIAHYLIHAYDNPELARMGLPAARAYVEIAPSAPHALHMPSHIFTQLGLWQDSINSNLAARVAAHQQGDIGEELHSMDYLMYAYLQVGNMTGAVRLLHELQRMPDLPVTQFKVGYAAAAMPARYAIERRAWAEAAAIQSRNRSLPQVLAVTYSAHVLGLARAGKPNAATAELARLNELLPQVRSAGDDYWANQMEIQIEEGKAWVAHARGQHEQAVSLLRSVAEKEDALEKRPVTPGPIVPAREQLGDLLLELNRPREALREFESSLAHSPRRRGALSGAARAAELSGDQRKAAQFQSGVAR